MTYQIAHGACGQGPIHLLMISAAEIGFVWDWVQQGRILLELHPLWLRGVPILHFRKWFL